MPDFLPVLLLLGLALSVGMASSPRLEARSLLLGFVASLLGGLPLLLIWLRQLH